MEIELEIAKIHIKSYKKYGEDDPSGIWFNQCLIHKATCQRWLEFLDKRLPNIDRASPTGQLLMDLQIDDLKQAIKLYEDVGI